MHLKQQKRGSGRVYLSIEESFRVGGKTKSRHVQAVGYVDDLATAECPDPVAFWKAEVARRNAEAKAAAAPIMVKFTAERRIDKRDREGQVDLGAAVPSAYFHRDLGIGGFFERRRTARNFDYDPCRILELLAWNRIASPASKKRAWEARGRFPRKCPFSPDAVYRSLDYLDANADALVRHMNASMDKARGPRNRTRLYYDVTNYYFEVDGEDDGDGLRRRGASKEHRPEPIVQMGLLLDGDGVPMDYDLFPGNTGDMPTMLPVMKKAGLRRAEGDPGAGRVVMVADKGLNTSDNIAACTLDGNGFIISQSVRKATRALKAWVLDGAGYEGNAAGTFKIKSRISDKRVRVTCEDGKRREVKVPVKEIAFRPRDYFERSRIERERVVEKSRAAVARGDMAGVVAGSAARYAKDLPVVKATGEAASHNWTIDEGKIAADGEMDGYYCIITSEQEMGDLDVIDAYRGLWRIEESFRVTKGDFDARPVFVSTQAHIRAHFLICYVALLIMRLMQLDTGRRHSAERISEALRNVVGHRMDANLYLFDYRTDLTDELAAAAGIDLSRQVLRKGRISQVMADVRKPRS